jgi:hypothetical protein
MKARRNDPLETLGLRLKHERRPPAAVAPVKAGTDKRARVIRADADDQAELRRRVRATLDDATDETVGAVTEDLRAAKAAASVIAAKFIEAGRALLRLQEHAGPGGYAALLHAGLVPFSEATASKLRTVAAAVDDGRLPATALPTTLEPAYAAAKLAAPERERLIEAGVIRPGASRREIDDAARPKPPTAPSDRDGRLPAGGTLTRERRRELERLRDRLLARVAAIEMLLAAG